MAEFHLVQACFRLPTKTSAVCPVHSKIITVSGKIFKFPFHSGSYHPSGYSNLDLKSSDFSISNPETKSLN